jgi:uncharacterized membrane protein YagU involved in acid resistance
MEKDSGFNGIWKAAAAGVVAVWVMDRFDWLAFAHENPRARQRTEMVRPGGMDPAHALADQVAGIIGMRLGAAAPHRHPAGLLVHYAVPMGLAILYRALKQRMPIIGKGAGTLYGAGTFLLLDEVMNPLLGLAASPAKYPWQRHAREMTAHVIYGAVTHAVLSLTTHRGPSSKFDLREFAPA